MQNLDDAQWIKSRKSSGSGQCVQVAKVGDKIAVRDSKNPDGPVLVFTAGEWDAFTEGVRDGDFNAL